MSITEFLLARIAEDEIRAEQASSHSYGGTFANDEYGWLLVQPARILAECEAKRAIVDSYAATTKSQGALGVKGMSVAYEIAVKCLAAVYSDHEDFKPEWKVGA